MSRSRTVLRLLIFAGGLSCFGCGSKPDAEPTALRGHAETTIAPASGQNEFPDASRDIQTVIATVLTQANEPTDTTRRKTADELMPPSFGGATFGDATQWIAEVIRKVNGVCARAAGQTEPAYPTVKVYPSLEEIGLRRGDMAPVQYDSENGVLHLVPSFLEADKLTYDGELWRALLNLQDWTGGDLDRPTAYLLAGGIQRAFSEELGYAETFERKLRIANAISTRGFPVSDNGRPAKAYSPLLMEFVALSRSPPLSALDGKAVDRLRGEGMIDALISERRAPPYAGARRKNEDRLPYRLAGMTFAHEGYRVYNGYGGERIKTSLDSLARLKVNALAVVPYTFMRSPSVPAWLEIPTNPGAENDAATTYALRQANGRGWYTLLKPQIWVGGGSWPGEVDFATEAEWEAWFGYYTHWMTHYAVLAEWEGVNGLCVGTELVRSTVEHPERWRTLIGELRPVFRGEITYAANWGEEFKRLRFGEELDFLGLNAYYPLTTARTPGEAELARGVKSWLRPALAKAQDLGKPLVLTEVGFRSTTTPWANPHAEAGERAADPAAQATAYSALRHAVVGSDLRGMFVWKWPSYLGYNHRGEGTGFTPAGKPAAGVLERFYREWHQTPQKR